jgi:hypothetical protein
LSDPPEELEHTPNNDILNTPILEIWSSIGIRLIVNSVLTNNQCARGAREYEIVSDVSTDRVKLSDMLVAVRFLFGSINQRMHILGAHDSVELTIRIPGTPFYGNWTRGRADVSWFENEASVQEVGDAITKHIAPWVIINRARKRPRDDHVNSDSLFSVKPEVL